MKPRGKTKGHGKAPSRAKAAKARPASTPAKPASASDDGLQRELAAAREQLAATSDVLRVIASAPGDLQRVFKVILENATRICEAKFGNLWLREGESFRIAATHGAPPEYREFLDREPVVIPDPKSGLGVITRTKQLVHITDIKSVPINKDRMRSATIELANGRSLVGVPLLKDNEVVGAIVIYRQEVRPFTEKQTALLTNFAAQAVIAIENTRLLSELRESLAQQTATSEVLSVISSSPGDLQPVFESVLANATRLCEAHFGILDIYANGAFRTVAMHNVPQEFAELRRREPVVSADPQTGLGRVLATKQLVHISDYAEDAAYTQRAPAAVRLVELAGARTLFIVPMLKELEIIGVIAIYRREVRPFTDKQIALVTNFAAQAVIAIENARLLTELREALAQQTATSEVLGVISSSPGELEPVFQSMLENATRLCGASFGSLLLCEGHSFRIVAMHNMPAAFAERWRREPVARPGPLAPLSRAAASKDVVHIVDLFEDAAYRESDPPVVSLVDEGGVRSILVVPMLKEGEPIGTFNIYRQEASPFSEKQIELVRNFAAQAVIAIENTRLLNELRESLEQQTATSEVLRVISSSPGDLQAVFAAMLENATRICEAELGTLWLTEGDNFRILALHGAASDLWGRRQPDQVIRFHPDAPLGRLAVTRRPVHIADITAEPAYLSGFRPLVELADIGGVRTLLIMPMLKETDLVGAIAIYRQEVRPFSDKQMQLLRNFAAQAVIAIENARLLNELRELLAQQTATSEVLKVISTSPGDLKPVFDAMLENAARLCEAPFGNLFLRDGGVLRIVTSRIPAGSSTRLFEPGSELVVSENRSHPLVHVLELKEAIHLADVRTAQAYIEGNPRVVAFADKAGARTAVCVPMLKDDECIGVFVHCRLEVRPFTDKQIELVKNFADQAVIAIENARLLSELRELLEQQTATSNVLEVISRSAFDLRAVFETVAESSIRLCGADRAFIMRYDGELLRVAATYNASPEFEKWVAQHPVRPGRHSASARAALERRTIHIPDVLADPEYTYAVGSQGVEPYRTLLGVPILKGDELLGVIIIYHLEVNPFTDKQIALVETFADQAAIAMENVRLFEAEQQRTRELTELLEQQTATSEVLQVISSSPGDLQPVFDTMLENAVRICDAKFGNIYRWDGDALHHVAALNTPAAFAEARKNAPFRPAPINPVSQMIATKAPIHFDDAMETEAYLTGDPVAVASVKLAGLRAFLAVPMLKENELVGAFTLGRQEVRPFTDKQIELVTSFASQAVIAIENARLLSELRELLERQTATSEVLGVISRSKFELQPILQSVVDTAERLCRAEQTVIFRLEDGVYRFAAGHSANPAYLEIERNTVISPGTGTAVARAAMTRQVVRIDDAWNDPLYDKKDDAKVGGVRSMIGVPLMRNGEPIGVIALARGRVEPFDDREIELVTTFADQAVIAIENVRLFEAEQQRTRELTESLEQQTATADVLRVISSSPGDLQPVFATMLENAVRISGAKFGIIHGWDGENSRLLATHNLPPAFEEARRRAPTFRPGPKTGIRRMAATKSVIHIPDLREDEAYLEEATPQIIAAVEQGGVRTMLAVPMLKENEVVGAFTVYRQEVRDFTDKQIDLVTNFAAQAVIAIENARLLTSCGRAPMSLPARSRSCARSAKSRKRSIRRSILRWC